MTDGLLDRQRDAILDVLTQHPRVERVRLFGSRAMGTHSATSDIDLALDGDLSFTDEADLARQLDELTIPYTVDLVRTSTITSDALEGHLVEHGQVWWAEPKTAEEIFVTTLGELCKQGGGSIQTGPFGSQLHASDYVDDGIPSIMPKNISVERIDDVDIARVRPEDVERLSKYVVREGDIVYSRRGDVEKCSLVTAREDGWLCGTGCIRIRLGPTAQVSPVYLHAYLACPKAREWITRHAVGATMPNLNTSILSSVPIEVRSKPIRRLVEEAWAGLNARIELNRQMSATLEAMAQALFQAWFVDFEPVKAKQAAIQHGLDPEQAAIAALSGKLRVPRDADDLSRPDLVAAINALGTLSDEQRHSLAETAALFPSELVETDLGLTPNGWVISEIGQEASIYGGATPRTKNPKFWEGGIHPWATPKDLSGLDNKAILGTNRHITDAGVAVISSGQLPQGTVLLSSRAPVGYLAIAEVPLSINQGFIALVCDKRLPAQYVLWWLHSNMDEIKQRAGGSTFAEISKKNFRPIPCLVPRNEVLSAFSVQTALWHAAVVANLQEAETLGALRDSLLPELLSGELSIA